jgi:DNA-binding beta-propeller fold protein YncE
VVKMDARTFREEARENFWTPSYRVRVNEDKDTVLVAQPLRSKILEIDGKTLKPLRTLQAGLGTRDIQFVRSEGKVYASNTFEGTFTETDYKTGKIVNRYLTGPYTRGIYYDPSTRRKYAVSLCGVFEIMDRPQTRH